MPLAETPVIRADTTRCVFADRASNELRKKNAELLDKPSTESARLCGNSFPPPGPAAHRPLCLRLAFRLAM